MKKWIFLSLLIVMSPLHSEEEKVEKLLQKAATYFKANEPQKAIPLYEEALKKVHAKDKKDVINYNLGVAQLESENYLKAIDTFEKIFEKNENLFQKLAEKSRYNLLLSYILLSEKLLSEGNKSDLLSLSNYLKKADEHLQLLNKEHDFYPEISEKYKGLKSKYYHREKESFLSELSFEKGIEFLKEKAIKKVNWFENLGEKEISQSMTKYFLNKSFAHEKQLEPIWEKLKENLKAALDSLDEGDEKAFELKSNFKHFQEGYHEYLSSLDCMKENNLWLGRYKSAKAKLHLSLIDLHLKKKDPIEFCLNQRLKEKKKQLPLVRSSNFYHALSKEIKLLNNFAALYLESLIASFESEEFKDKALFLSLSDVLKNHLKVGTDFEYDQSLYEQLKKQPEEILFPIYMSYCLNEEMSKEQSLAFKNKLKATNKRFDLQSKLDYGTEKKENILFAKEKISSAYNHFLAKDSENVKKDLEDFFLKWNFKPLLFSKLSKVRKRYAPFTSKAKESAEMESLSSELSEIETTQKRIEAHTSEKELLEFLNTGILKAKESLMLNQQLNNYRMKKPLLNNSDLWTQRLCDALEEKKESHMDMIRKGIKEQKNALGLTQDYPKAKFDSENEKSFFDVVKDSQNYPSKAVANFLTTFLEHQSTQEDDESQAQVLHYFSKGLKYANEAEEKLSEEVIDWEKVVSLQQKVVENWEKIINNDQQSSPNKEEMSDASCEQQGQISDLQSGDENKQPQEQEEQFEDTEKIMGILERLQKMQQDDQIIKKNNQATKKGLRPW